MSPTPGLYDELARGYGYSDTASAATRIKELTDQLMKAEEYLASASTCCCGEPMDNHSSAWNAGHSPVSMLDYHIECLQRENDRLEKELADTKTSYEAKIAKLEEQMQFIRDTHCFVV